MIVLVFSKFGFEIANPLWGYFIASLAPELSP